MRNNPTMIADYSKLAPRHHSKFDMRFTSLPGADAPPVDAAKDLFPAQDSSAQDTFVRVPSSKTKADAAQAPGAAAKSEKTSGVLCGSRCVVS